VLILLQGPLRGGVERLEHSLVSGSLLVEWRTRSFQNAEFVDVRATKIVRFFTLAHVQVVSGGAMKAA